MDWADSRFDLHKQLMTNVESASLADRAVVMDDVGTPGDEGWFYTRYAHAKKVIHERLGVKMDLLD